MKEINYELFRQFESKNHNLIKAVEIFKHGFRINGVCDVYKQGFCVYDLVNNIYHKFEDRPALFSFVVKFIEENPQRQTFNSKQNGKITFKAFNRNKELADWRPEQYHWENFKDQQSDDCLYFIKDTLGRIKIGRSINPEQRVKNLQTSTSSSLKLMFVVKNKGCLEKNLHGCFGKLRVRGEWFSYTKRFDEFFQFIYERTPELVTIKPSIILDNR